MPRSTFCFLLGGEAWGTAGFAPTGGMATALACARVFVTDTAGASACDGSEAGCASVSWVGTGATVAVGARATAEGMIGCLLYTS